MTIRISEWAPLIEFTLLGAPRTKKNSGRIITRGKPRILPSLAYEEWNAAAQQQFMGIRSKCGVQLPITEDVNVSALFYRHANVGDAVGFMQAIADSMQEAGIVLDDKQVVSWDGTRLLKDASNPRIVVTVVLARDAR